MAKQRKPHKKLSKASTKIMDAILTLWCESGDPIRPLQIVEISGCNARHIYMYLVRLEEKGYIEKIYFKQRYNRNSRVNKCLFEVKPLKNIDGSDFISVWQSPSDSLPRPVMRVPRLPPIIHSKQQIEMLEKYRTPRVIIHPGDLQRGMR